MKKQLKLDELLNHPEIILLSFGVLVGLLFCFFIPYGAGFDEISHLVRIFEISKLKIIPNKDGTTVPYQFFMYSYQRRYFQNPAYDLFYKRTFFTRPVWRNTTRAWTNSTYFPIIFLLPVIVAVVFWTLLNLSVLPTIILMRFVGFAFYLLACYLTLRMLPVGKWVFLVLALSPMALFQASTLNTDGFTNAISFLFIGYILKVYSERETPIGSKKAWVIVLLTVLVGCTKPGTFLMLLLLLLLVKNKFRSKKLILLIIGGTVLSVLISAEWSIMALADFQIGNTTLMNQAILALKNLPDFIPMFLKGLVLSSGKYFHDWVGVYGYWVGKVPEIVYIIFPIALFFAFLHERKNQQFTKRGRILIFVVSLVCLVGIASYQFVLGYRIGVQGSGAQGRYFLPFTPMLFLAFAGLFQLPERFRRISGWLTISFLVAAVSVYGYGIYRTYYTNCVFAVTPSQPCTLPVYKNFDLGDSAYRANVNSQIVVSQSIKPICDELSSVIVRVETATGESNDKLKFSLLDDVKNVIASQEYPISTMQEYDRIKLPVTLKVKPGQTTLWLQLATVAGDSSGAAVDFLGRAEGDIYSDGTLFFNQQEQDGDLYFQYTCSIPPENRISINTLWNN